MRGALLLPLLLAALPSNAIAQGGPNVTPPVAAPGSIVVDVSNVPGEIVLDGFLTGELAPTVLENVGPGEHEIQIEYGCMLAKGRVAVPSGGQVRARMRVRNRGGNGSIRVRGVPNWAAVFIDDVPVEDPQGGAEVSCGDHEVSVEARGSEPWSTQVLVTTGKWVKVDIDDDWEGLVGDLDAAPLSEGRRRDDGGEDFDLMEEDDFDDFDDWEDLEPDELDRREESARNSRLAEETARRDTAAQQERQETERLEAEAELASLEAAKIDAEARVEEARVVMAEAEEGLRAAEEEFDEAQQAAAIINSRLSEARRTLGVAMVEVDLPPIESETESSELSDLAELDEATSSDSATAPARDRRQARLERRRRAEEEARRAEDAEEERARLQGRLDDRHQPRRRRSRGSVNTLRAQVTGGLFAVGVAGLGFGTYGYFKEQALWDDYDGYCAAELALNPDEPCGFTRDLTQIPSEDAQLFRSDKIDPAHQKMVIGFAVGGGAMLGAGASWLFLSMEDGGASFVIRGRF